MTPLIPFIDLKTQFKYLEEDIRAGINDVLEHGMFILGPEVKELEKQLAQFAAVKHAVTCSSGTDALLMPLMAQGIGPGDVVFTTLHHLPSLPQRKSYPCLGPRRFLSILISGPLILIQSSLNVLLQLSVKMIRLSTPYPKQ